MKAYNVLIFPCGTEIANEIINSLQNHKYFKLNFASSAGTSYCNFRANRIDILPYVTEEAFISELNLLIKTRLIDFIIPAHDDVAYALSFLEGKINAQVIGQSQYVNEIVRFKDVTYEYFKNQLPIANIFQNSIISNHSYPLFTKPKRGQGSQNSITLNNRQEFDHFFSMNKFEDFVLMECLQGEEYTIDCFSHHGQLLYFGARTREKTTRGISVQSTFITDPLLNEDFQRFAEIINRDLKLQGIWFYQMKQDSNGQLKLLEIGPRVSGTMMLNRARGVNFVELALYQKLGFDVEIIFNDIEISLARALVPIYRHQIEYKNLYIDFDDTLLLDEKFINTDLMKLVFQAKNEGKKVYLITKNKKNNLAPILHKFGVTNVFDGIIHLKEDDKKIQFMQKQSILVDDSFQERKLAHLNGSIVFGLDNFYILFK